LENVGYKLPNVISQDSISFFYTKNYTSCYKSNANFSSIVF
jgi:hypothetical protein